MDLADDQRTTTNSDRVSNAQFVRETIVEWTSRRTTSEVVTELGGIVPVGPVNTAADLFADPHLAAREMLVAVEHPGNARPAVLPNNPIRFSATPSGIYRRAPKLGEHSSEILAAIAGDLP
jgi:crotonobetainyl-CoA:carnitine CoA-transferase CaiB-like acyl-CoA transferase